MCGYNLTKDTEVVELLQPYCCDRCVPTAKSAWDTMQIMAWYLGELKYSMDPDL